jgi:hypothetical protein
MPWQETNPVLERHHFVQDLASGQWTMTELCERYGISRNTGYTWAHRYREHGVRALHDRSRAPRSSPHATPADIVAPILDEHTRFGWGARTSPRGSAGWHLEHHLLRHAARSIRRANPHHHRGTFSQEKVLATSPDVLSWISPAVQFCVILTIA